VLLASGRSFVAVLASAAGCGAAGRHERCQRNSGGSE